MEPRFVVTLRPTAAAVPNVGGLASRRPIALWQVGSTHAFEERLQNSPSVWRGRRAICSAASCASRGSGRESLGPSTTSIVTSAPAARMTSGKPSPLSALQKTNPPARAAAMTTHRFAW